MTLEDPFYPKPFCDSMIIQKKPVYELIKSVFGATNPLVGRLKMNLLIKDELLEGFIVEWVLC